MIPFSLTVTPISGTKVSLELQAAPAIVEHLVHALLSSNGATQVAPQPPHKKRLHSADGKEMPRKCAFCGNSFMSPFTGSRYCSNRCRDRNRLAHQQPANGQAASASSE